MSQPFFPLDENLDYLNEENVLNRFEYIFLTNGYEPAAQKTDFIKYYIIKYRNKLIRIRRRVIKKFKNTGF